jgi:hypothetical protein
MDHDLKNTVKMLSVWNSVLPYQYEYALFVTYEITNARPNDWLVEREQPVCVVLLYSL